MFDAVIDRTHPDHHRVTAAFMLNRAFARSRELDRLCPGGLIPFWDVDDIAANKWAEMIDCLESADHHAYQSVRDEREARYAAYLAER